MTGEGKPEERRLGLHPGSRMPGDSDEVDALLRRVPDVAFAPELEGCLFGAEALAGSSVFAGPGYLARLSDAAYVARLRAALEAVGERARREDNGGLQFLAGTLGHFLDGMPGDEHPLVVALWCRSWARRRGRDEVPAAIAVAMDQYESSRGSKV
ncbi:MAG TPA: hypothetical protein VGL81_36845 [Polyangiaceae bacterium]|jgi:hypothetical protein